MKIPESYFEPKKVSLLLSLGVLVLLIGIIGYLRSGNKIAPSKSISEITALWKDGKTTLALGEIEYAFYTKVYSPELLQLRTQIYLEQKAYPSAFEDLKRLVAEKQATLLEKYYFARLAEYLWGKSEALNLLEEETEPLLLSYKNWIQGQTMNLVPSLQDERQTYIEALLLMKQERWEEAQSRLKLQNHPYSKYHFALCALHQPTQYLQGYAQILELAQNSFYPALLTVGYIELRESRYPEAEYFFQKAKDLVPLCLWGQWGWLETQLRMNRSVSLEILNQQDLPPENTEHSQHTFHLDYPVDVENFPYPHLKTLYKDYSLYEQRACLNLLNHQPEIVLQQFENRPPISVQGKIIWIKALLELEQKSIAQEQIDSLLKEHPLIESYSLQGELALQNQKADEAKVAVYSALKIAPKQESLYYLLGQIYEKQGEHTRAITAYLHALSLKNTSLALTRLLQIFTQSGQLEKALELLQKYPQPYPGIDYLVAVGKLLVAAQNYENALIYWNQLLEISSSKIVWWEVYWNKALCLKSLNKEDRWLSFVRKTLGQNPPESIREQALNFFIEAGEWADVLEYLPLQHPQYRELQIRALMGIGHYEEVLELLSPENFSDVPDLLRLYRLQKNWSAQIRLLRRWIPLKPERSYLLYELAEAYFYKEEKENSLKVLQTLLKQDPSFVSGWILKGEILIRQQNFRESIPCFEEALHRYPTLAKAYYLKGKAHYALGEYEQSQIDYQKAVQQDSSYIRLHY